MKKIFLVSVLSLGACTGGSGDKNVESTESKGSSAQVYPSKVVEISSDWQLIWQDEFDGAEVDSEKWSFEQNCAGGGNDEQQCYTNRADNAFIENGHLVIKALKEYFTGPKVFDDDPNYDENDTKTLPYTSARLRSKGKGDWKYGRFEIRAKLPQGQGTWPAIWMLPTDWVYGPWAGSGEIDIMEAVNLGANSDEPYYKGNPEVRVHGTLHYGEAWPNNIYSGTGFRLPNNVNPADDFHEYALEWQDGEIRWYVDDIHYATQTSDNWFTRYDDGKGNLVSGEGSAPFDQDLHLILNLAVGGNWPSNVNDKGIDASVFPQTLEIDYVRVYQCSLDTETGKGCEAVSEQAIIVN